MSPAAVPPIAWLATIARNRAIDRRRALGLRPAATLDVVPEPADAAPLASDILLRDEEDRRLHGCLRGLTDDQRESIRIAFFDGVTYAELAERRGVPLSTVKSWIRRGLQGLKRCLDGDA